MSLCAEQTTSYFPGVQGTLVAWSVLIKVIPETDAIFLCSGCGARLRLSDWGYSLLNSGELGVTITIEDPVEYLHHKDTIFQREVGTKVKDFKTGLVDALRANPTTIVIGEIRDAETALEALKAGLNGHRVLATLHASSIKEAISRLWAFLDEQGDELLVQSLL
jgi:hypothetical protein